MLEVKTESVTTSKRRVDIPLTAWYALRKVPIGLSKISFAYGLSHEQRNKMSSVKRRSTIAEIALEAGVSIPTVSKVLNQRPDVAIETRQRVERIIMEKGYVRNRAARALGGGQSGLVDLVVSKSLDSEYFLEVIKGIEEILHQAGKSVVLSTLSDKTGSQDQHN